MLSLVEECRKCQWKRPWGSLWIFQQCLLYDELLSVFFGKYIIWKKKMLSIEHGVVVTWGVWCAEFVDEFGS